MQIRRSLTLLAVSLLLLGLRGTSAAQVKRYKFVVITHATAVPFFVPVRKGAEDAGKLVGAEVVYTGPAGFDIQKQVEFMKSAIAQKVDGIACTLPDPEAFTDVVKEALDKGIPVIAINADAPRSGRLAYIGQGNYEAGRSMGAEIVKLLPGGGDVLLAIHTAGAENLEARIKGVKDVLDAKGGFKHRVVATGTDLVKAEALIGAALQANPSIKGMFGVEDITGIAIGHIIERQKLRGKVFGGGFDLVGEILDAIERGDMQFTIDQQPYLQGFQGVMELYLNRAFAISPADINTGIAPVTRASVKAVKSLAGKGYR
jgi:simple sugar transport system substrate-binding protein